MSHPFFDDRRRAIVVRHVYIDELSVTLLWGEKLEVLSDQARYVAIGLAEELQVFLGVGSAD